MTNNYYQYKSWSIACDFELAAINVFKNKFKSTAVVWIRFNLKIQKWCRFFNKTIQEILTIAFIEIENIRKTI